ncbi:MAG: diaminopimelate epimerase [Bacteroidetes bacterium HGW-Bacteroidetes-6]|jgi:diaminopimelate epimerase|nr:MAG: diaminopimelate epimerase [Bacteroidetes bacterium HGW-Bacteroidetes-6]
MNSYYKFHGAGNDFILIDAIAGNTTPDAKKIEALCNRHTGIGADGLIVIALSEVADFRMHYFNSDGYEAEMCGNGARCSVAFAFSMNYCKAKTNFEASDGIHFGEILADNSHGKWQVKISLNIASEPQKMPDNTFFVNTGVPHNVRPLNSIENIDVKTEGAILRYNSDMFPQGANINFVVFNNNSITIRTYERGVENETLACGTGITASALVAHNFFGFSWPIQIEARGGSLVVDIQNDVLWLEGPATKVFTAETE